MWAMQDCYVCVFGANQNARMEGLVHIRDVSWVSNAEEIMKEDQGEFGEGEGGGVL
jgi:hypothetical protein